jgi:peptidyl-prolyl cis-trans isomerase D
VQDWYKRNIAKYTTPERRVIRYALVTPQQVAAQTTPTAAEIQQAYAADKAKYAPKPLRDVTLVTVLDQKAAQALTDKVKAGTPLAAAARSAGLEARTVTGTEQSALATQTAPAVAAALFAAPQGAVVGPLRGAIGFVVARVEKVTQDPGKTLDQARAEIVAALTKQKSADAIGKVRDAIEDSLADNANINEVARDQKLTVLATPAVLSSGVNPDQPQAQPDATLAPIVAAGFAAEDGDTPTTVPIGQDGGFAVAALDRIVPATPVPLAQARAQVVADFTAERARLAARAAADAIVAKVNAGTPLAAAVAQTGAKAPPVERVEATRAQITANQGQVNPVLAMMFGMKQNTARAIQAPDGRGWLVLRVDTVVPGDASKQLSVIQATRVDLGRSIGGEYAQQFANAVAAAQGAKRYPDAIATLKKDLLGGDAGQ